MMNDFDLCSNSPSFNLTNHQDERPIFSSTPLVIGEKAPPLSTSSSFFLPLTENIQNNEELIKLNEDLCLLGLFDYVPTKINIDQTLSLCRQLVKNFNKLSQEKHFLYEKLRKYENEQMKYEKQEDLTKMNLDRLEITKERLTDDLEKYVQKINQLQQLIQTKDKEIRRLNQMYNQQNTLAKHQHKSLEKQMNKLKEKFLNCEKNRMMISTIDYSCPLLLNETISSLSSSSSSEILLKKICHDYDEKHRLLLIENQQLRKCVIDIEQQLEHLLLIHQSPSETLMKINNDEKSFETQLMDLPCDAVYQIVQRHFSKIYQQIDRYFVKLK